MLKWPSASEIWIFRCFLSSETEVSKISLLSFDVLTVTVNNKLFDNVPYRLSTRICTLLGHRKFVVSYCFTVEMRTVLPRLKLTSFSESESWLVCPSCPRRFALPSSPSRRSYSSRRPQISRLNCSFSLRSFLISFWPEDKYAIHLT